MKQFVQYLRRIISSRFHQWTPLQCIANILLRNYSRLMPLLRAIFSGNDIVHRHLPWVSTLRVNRNWILNKWLNSSHKFTFFNKAFLDLTHVRHAWIILAMFTFSWKWCFKYSGCQRLIVNLFYSQQQCHWFNEYNYR